MPVSATELAMLSSPVPVPAELGDNQSPFTARDVSANSALSGATPDPNGVQLPVRSGTTRFSSENLPTSSLSNESLSTSTPNHFSGEKYSGPGDVVGERVGGLVGQRPIDPSEVKTNIPEAIDSLTKETNQFSSAYSEGYTSTENRKESSATTGMEIGAGIGSLLGPMGTVWGGAIGRGIGYLAGGKEGAEGDAGTMRAARLAKRDDRARDQQVRQAAAKELDKKIKESTGEDWNDFGKMLKRKKKKYTLQYEIRKSQDEQRKTAWKDFKSKRDLEDEYLDEMGNVDQYL